MGYVQIVWVKKENKKVFFNCQQDDIGSLSERQCEQPGSSKPAGGTDVLHVFIKQLYSIEHPPNHLRDIVNVPILT